MVKPLLVVLALVAALFLACGEVEEQVSAPETSPAATAPATPTATPAATLTPTPSAAPTSPPAAVPADWATFTDAAGRFVFRYPSSWYVSPDIVPGRVMSWDPATWKGFRYPPGGILIDIYLASLDPAQIDAAAKRPPEATDTPLGGEPGWEYVTVYDPPAPDGRTLCHAVTADHAGYRFGLIACFAQDSPDEPLFQQIATSFAFTK